FQIGCDPIPEIPVHLRIELGLAVIHASESSRRAARLVARWLQIERDLDANSIHIGRTGTAGRRAAAPTVMIRLSRSDYGRVRQPASSASRFDAVNDDAAVVDHRDD